MALALGKMKSIWTHETILVATITALAGFFRLFEIARVPPGLHYDEAYHAFDVLRLLQGQFAIFFSANNGREPLYLYLATLAVALFGPTALALRLTSSIIGIITIPVIYGFTRALFHSVRIAALAALLSAISIWHVYLSRFGERMILAVLFILLALWFFWRGIALISAGDVAWKKTYVLAGVFTAIAVYSYTNARLLPIILIIISLGAILLDRANVKQYFVGLALAGIVALILFLPLGSYFYDHKDEFLTHTSNLSILDPRVNKGDLTNTFKENLFAVAGMFLVQGDRETFRNIPNRPVFDLPTGILFLVGLLALLGALFLPRSSRPERLRAILIATSLVVFLSTSVLSDDAPVFTRTLPAMPFAMMLAAWGASAIWDQLGRWANQKIIALGFAVLILASAIISFRDYFIDFASSPATYAAFASDKIDAANWVVQESPTAQVFLAPLWYQDPTVSFYTRNSTLKSFESRDTIVLPRRAAGKDALIAFPLEQEKKSATLGERLGALAAREEVRGSNGERILIAQRVRANDLPDPQNPLAILARAGAFAQPQTKTRATWDALELLGYSLAALDAPKRNLEATLLFHSRATMQDDYTFSLKVRDEKNRVWGQEDKWLGDNSYATSAMSAGDLVIEKFYPGLNACAPAGEYRVSVEMYNPRTNQVAPLADGKTIVSLGTTRADASLGNLYEHLDPEQTLDLDIAPQMRLFGFTLTPDEVKAGDEFSLSLFWRGVGDGKISRHIAVRLQNATLAERDITLPPEGRGLCTLFDLRAPANIAPGARAVFVNDVKIGTLNLK